MSRADLCGLIEIFLMAGSDVAPCGLDSWHFTCLKGMLKVACDRINGITYCLYHPHLMQCDVAVQTL